MLVMNSTVTTLAGILDFKVDEANMDPSIFVDSSSQWIQALELERVSNYESRPKNLKSLKSKLRKVSI